MQKQNFHGMAERLASGVSRVRRRTWIAAGLGLVAIFGLLIWAAVSIFSWLWGQGQSLSQGAPSAVRAIVTQVEQAVPGAREALGGLGDLLPALKPAPPPRDVSGTDIGPVPRYLGLVRSHFSREGSSAEVSFVGQAAFDGVLAHYVKGFAAAGYAQEVLTATHSEERHRFVLDRNTYEMRLVRQSNGLTEVVIKGPILQADK